MVFIYFLSYVCIYLYILIFLINLSIILFIYYLIFFINLVFLYIYFSFLFIYLFSFKNSLNNEEYIMWLHGLYLHAIVELARVCHVPSVTSSAGAPESRDLEEFGAVWDTKHLSAAWNLYIISVQDNLALMSSIW